MAAPPAHAPVVPAAVLLQVRQRLQAHLARPVARNDRWTALLRELAPMCPPAPSAADIVFYLPLAETLVKLKEAQTVPDPAYNANYAWQF